MEREQVDVVKMVVADLEANPKILPQTDPDLAGSLVGATTCQDIINRLRLMETTHRVRFLALPVEALERIRREWEDESDEDFRTNAIEMVGELLGGIDGHLTCIDAVLGPTGNV